MLKKEKVLAGIFALVVLGLFFGCGAEDNPVTVTMGKDFDPCFTPAFVVFKQGDEDCKNFRSSAMGTSRKLTLSISVHEFVDSYYTEYFWLEYYSGEHCEIIAFREVPPVVEDLWDDSEDETTRDWRSKHEARPVRSGVKYEMPIERGKDFVKPLSKKVKLYYLPPGWVRAPIAMNFEIKVRQRSLEIYVIGVDVVD